MPYEFSNDPIVYSPQGRDLRCSEVVAMQGGWSNITAEQASQLAALGCTQPFMEYQDLYASPLAEVAQSGGDSGGGYLGPLPADEVQPYIQDQVSYAGPDSAPTVEANVNLAEFFSGSELQTNPIEYAGPTFGNLLQEIQQFPSAPQVIDQLGQAIFGQSQIPQISVNAGFAKCLHQKRRQRVKLVVMPDGSRQVIPYCAPRRMNPCNPRALGRAARRLGMFQKMSSHIEKLINHQLKRKSRPRLAMACAPRKRCR